jgi:hypothetical protein
MPSRRRLVATGLALTVAGTLFLGIKLYAERVPRRVVEVVPGRVFRGAWQSPEALRRLISLHHVHTIVTLTAINPDDPKYVAQRPIVDEAGVTWVIVPMRGSTATLGQLAEAADLVADPSRRPVFFHCVGGHHRSNLVQMAYRVRHEGWTAERAWDEVARLPWTQPDAVADQNDRRLIVSFEAQQRAQERLMAGRTTP